MYSAVNCVGLRRCTSVSAIARNTKLRELKKRSQAAVVEPVATETQPEADESVAEDAHVEGCAGAVHDEAGAYAMIPEEFKEYTVSFVCLHGVVQKNRGRGERSRGSSKYTGCTARVTGQVQQDPVSGTSYVQVIQELTNHNHAVNQHVFDTYWRISDLPDKDLFAKAVFAWEMGADAKRVRQFLSRELGSTYTRRQWENFTAAYLGGPDALRGLKVLLSQFATFDGTRELIMEDEDDQVAGIVLQTAMQRTLFQRYGDSLVLDWTHNTNNLGFYLGSLMVTSASGKGVSVLDCLCVAQTHEMMENVFNFFTEHNPGAKEKIKSVLVDKDYKEWTTVEKCFPLTKVVLCIFHVLKWFKFVTTLTKYSLEDGVRSAVVKVLRKMVFVPDMDAFAAQQQILAGLLVPKENPGHREFLSYMDACWYNCIEKWSYAGRGFVFTAANTTSNRLESYWNHYKTTLGGAQRIDTCVQAIFVHGSSVMRREKGMASDYQAAKPVYEHADEYVRPVLMELSKYAAGLVQRKWLRYAATRNKVVDVEVHRVGAARMLSVSGAQQVTFAVNTDQWTYSCHFHKGNNLTCRHLFFVV